MKIENDYPRIKKKIDKFLLIKKIILIIFFVSLIAVTIVNLSIGGKPWMLYVLFGELIIYFLVLNKPLIDDAIIKRITIVLFIICAYLYVIDFINKTNWSYFVISILAFSTLIFQLLLFIFRFKFRRNKFVTMFITSLFAIIFCLLAIVKVFKINWPIIVFGSLGLFNILLLFSFLSKEIISDLKKYFNYK